MKALKIFFSLAIVAGLLLSSCSTHKKGYKPKKRKKKDCDCSDWTYHPDSSEKNLNALLLCFPQKNHTVDFSLVRHTA